MKRIDRLEMNALSKEVFGTSSKWQKIYNRGVLVAPKEGSNAHTFERNGLLKIRELMLAAKAALARGEKVDVPQPVTFINRVKGYFTRS